MGERATWREMPLGELVDVLNTRRVPVSAVERAKRPGSVPYYGATGQVGLIDESLFDEELVLLGEDGVDFFSPDVPKAYLIDGPSWVNNHAHVLRAKDGICSNRFLVEALNLANYSGYATGSTRTKLTKSALLTLPVVVPPLSEQQRIVRAMGAVDGVIAGAKHCARCDRELLGALTERQCPVSPDGGDGEVPLTELASFINGRAFKPSEFTDEGIPVIRIKQLMKPNETPDLFDGFVDERHRLANGDIVFSWSGSLEVVRWYRGPAALNQHLFKVVPNDGISPDWLTYVLRASVAPLSGKAHGTTMKHIRRGALGEVFTPLPTADEMQQVGALLGHAETVLRRREELIRKLGHLRRVLLSNLIQAGGLPVPESVAA